MPQPGIHAVVAVAARRYYPREAWFTIGAVFGALLPDVDVYAQGVAVLFGGMRPMRAYLTFHNTFTHSLLSAAALWMLLALLSFALRKPRLLQLANGLGLGMTLLHTLPDLFLWFDGVGILWPVYSLNLWGWLHPPDLLRRLLMAGDFYAFYAFFVFLGMLSRRTLTNRSYKIQLRQFSYLQLGMGVIFTLLAVMLPAGIFDLYYTFAYALIAFPNAIYVTWRMRETIIAPSLVRRKHPNPQSLIIDNG